MYKNLKTGRFNGLLSLFSAVTSLFLRPKSLRVLLCYAVSPGWVSVLFRSVNVRPPLGNFPTSLERPAGPRRWVSPSHVVAGAVPLKALFSVQTLLSSSTPGLWPPPDLFGLKWMFKDQFKCLAVSHRHMRRGWWQLDLSPSNFSRIVSCKWQHIFCLGTITFHSKSLVYRWNNNYWMTYPTAIKQTLQLFY